MFTETIGEANGPNVALELLSLPPEIDCPLHSVTIDPWMMRLFADVPAHVSVTVTL
jgi:hypothetical protein